MGSNVSIQLGAIECSKFDLSDYNQKLEDLLSKDPENYNIKFQMLKRMISSDIQGFRGLFNDVVKDLSTESDRYWLNNGEVCLNMRILFSLKK